MTDDSETELYTGDPSTVNPGTGDSRHTDMHATADAGTSMPEQAVDDSAGSTPARLSLTIPDLAAPKLMRSPEPPDIARCHGVSALSLGLPSTLAVESKRGRIPKETFYRHMGASASLKREFIDSIEAFTMLAFIQPERIGVKPGAATSEIAVLGVGCRSTKIPQKALGIIAQSVEQATKPARRMLFALCRADTAASETSNGNELLIDFAQLAVWRDANVAAGLYKGTLRVNRPAPCSRVNVTLPTTADTMDEVWDSLCAQVILHDADFHAVDRRIAALDRKRELQKQADKLRKAIIRTNQTARRNQLWDELRAVEDKLRHS